MNPAIHRALGAWVSSIRTDLVVRGHGAAQPGLPTCTVVELSAVSEPLSCASKDVASRNGNGVVVRSGRVVRHTINYRLTFTVPSSRSKNGKKILGEILTAVEDALLRKRLVTHNLQLTDPETQTVYQLEAMRFDNSQYIGEDDQIEPVLYRGSITLAVVRLLVLDEATTAIKQIHQEDIQDG